MKIKYIIFIFILLLFISASADAEKFPLIVYSGEPEGVMAAVSAARRGTETLLILNRKDPGGLMTYGKLNYLDLSYGPGGNILCNNLFAEWHKKVGGNVTFSIDKAKNVFNNMINSEKNLTVYRNCKLIDVKLENNIINNIIIEHGDLKKSIKAKRIIDTSQDADLAVKAKAKYFYGGADIGLPERAMAATLILSFDNININRLKNDVKTNKYGPSYINKRHAWGFIELGRMYKQHHPNVRLRGLNIVFRKNNKESYYVLINGMLIFNQELSSEKAYNIGKQEAVFIKDYLNENLGGFENAVLSEFPRELYIRESRHIVARYQLKTSDLLVNKIPADAIALASYPLDYQASDPDYEGFVLFNPDIYGIPFRSLIPCNLNNLLIASRAAGYSSLAAASARVLPTGMSTAEAAGIAAAVSINKNIMFNEMVERKDIIELIQEELFIKNNIPKNENKFKIIEDEILIPYINELISWGLVMGGYNNNYRLEDKIKETFFANILIKGLKRKEAEILYDWVPGGLTTTSKEQYLTRDRAAMLLLVATSHRLSDIESKNYYSEALKYNLIPDYIKKHIIENRLLNRREAFIIAGDFLMKYSAPRKLRFLRGED